MHRGTASYAEPVVDAENRLAKDGSLWRHGTVTDVEWIHSGTVISRTIASAIPPVFAAYATMVVPDDHTDRDRQDAALLQLLKLSSADGQWWLGYLDTGADDVVFPDAARVRLYSGWNYVVVEAGSEQAATWRSNGSRSWRGALPDLMFPTDRAWLVSYLWDDTWRCVGGSRQLIDDLLCDDILLGREVTVGEDATPPGRAMF
ncbi:hypothetical protein acdb102_20000 [Acidothermaceae bacterium B102]|nr:hypothetical protein acdb102_20000 [Acidothermaceae bacterium B102]